MNGHCDADGIADYRAGLITGRRAQEIAAHLAACAQCTAVGARVAEVSALLAGAPQPVMPNSVAARLHAAFAAEPALTGSSAEAKSERISSEQTVVTPAKPRFRLPRIAPRLLSPRLLAPVAAVAVLAAGGFGLSQLAGSSGPSAASSAAGGAATSPEPSSFAANRSLASGHGASGHENEGFNLGTNGTVKVAVSGTDFQAATLGQQLETLFQSRSELRSTDGTTALKACVRAVAGSKPVKLVASAHYRGAPATVVIVSHGDGYQGLIAGANCSATNSDIVARAVLTPGISTP